MKITHIVLFIMLSFSQVFAGETNKKIEVAEKLVDLFHMDKMYTRLLDQIQSSEIAMMESMYKEEGASDEIIKAYKEGTEQTMKVMKKTFPWDKMKAMLVSAHAEVYSFDEMTALANFYQTPIGQKCIDKQPQLSASIMQSTQAFMMKIMPEIKKELKLNKEKLNKQLEKKEGA